MWEVAESDLLFLGLSDLDSSDSDWLNPGHSLLAVNLELIPELGYLALSRESNCSELFRALDWSELSPELTALAQSGVSQGLALEQQYLESGPQCLALAPQCPKAVLTFGQGLCFVPTLSPKFVRYSIPQ